MGSSPISLDARGDINYQGQLISLGTITLQARDDVRVTPALAGLATSSGPSGIGTLVVAAEQGSVTLAGGRAIASVTVTASDGVTVADSSLVAGGSISIDGGGGTVTIGDADTFAATAALQTTTANQAISIDTTGAVTLNQSLLTAGGDIRIGHRAPAGSVTATRSGAVLDTGAATGNVSVMSNAAVDLRGVRANGSVTIAGASIGNTGDSILGLGPVSLDANSGDIALSVNDANVAEIVSRSGRITIEDAGSVTMGAGGLSSVGGDILLGTATARLGSLTSIGVLDTGQTAGRVEVFATDNVALSGITTGGDVSVSGGSVTNATRSIVSGGGVTIASAGNMTLGGPENAAAIDAIGAVGLFAPGTVRLNGDVVSTSGVTIGGAAARVAALEAGTALVQAGRDAAASSDAAIYTSGDLMLGEALVGEAGTVLVDSGGAVTLSRGFGGFSGSQGIGGLDIDAVGPVAMTGTRAVDSVTVTSAGFSNATASIQAGDAVTIDADAGAVTLSAVGSAAAIDAGGTVSVYTTGALTVNNGIRSGAATILAGRADGADADAEPDAALGSLDANTVIESVGTTTIRSTGAVSLNGISSGGLVDISGSIVQNSAASIVGQGVTLTAGAGGITLDRILGSNSTVAAGIDGRGGNVVLATAPTAAVNLNSGILTDGGNIAIGRTAARVNSVRLGEGVTLQTFTGTTPVGSIDLYAREAVSAQSAVGQVARGLVGGAITIDTADGVAGTAGTVALDGLYGLDSDGDPATDDNTGIGRLTITADGEVSLRGARTQEGLTARSAGNVTLDGSGVGGRTIDGTGNVSLESTGGGSIVIDTIFTEDQFGQDLVGAAINLQGSGSVRIATEGAAVLRSDIETDTGAISIGSTGASVASLDTEVITSRDRSTFRGIVSSSAIELHAVEARIGDLLGGNASGITVRVGTTLEVNGVIRSSDGGAVSFVDIEGRDVVVRGGIAASGASPVSGYGVRIVVPGGGSITLGDIDDFFSGPVSSTGGPVLLGLQSALAGDAPAYVLGGGGTENATLYLYDNIVTTYHDVTVNADLVARFSNDWYGWSDFPGPSDDRFQPLIGVPVDPAAGRDFDSLPYQQLGHQPDQLCSELGIRCTWIYDEFNDLYELAFPGNQSTDPVNWLYYFGARDVVVVSQLGRPRGNDLETCASGAALLCGYRYGDDLTTAVNSAQARLPRLQVLLGSATIGIDVGDGDGGANVTVNGHVGRETRPSAPCVGLCDGQSVVHSSYVNSELRFDVGAGGSLQIDGVIGDTLTAIERTTNSSFEPIDPFALGRLNPLVTIIDPNVPDSQASYWPELGTFAIRLEGTGGSFAATGRGAAVTEHLRQSRDRQRSGRGDG